MDRTLRLFTRIATGVVFAALLFGSAPASAARTKARKHHVKPTCTRRLRGHSHRTIRKCARHRKRRHHRHATAALRTHSPARTGRTLKGGAIVGLVANASAYGGAGTAGRLDQISSQTGSRWLREDFLWNTIEPGNGTYDFTYYDHFMLLAAQKGFHVLPVLDGTPTWIAAHENDIPTDPNAYAAYTAAIVKRYGPHGSFFTEHPELATYAITTYEIWNEPYYPGGSDNTYDPARYANLVKAAATAGRAADPTTKYLLAADVDAGQQTGNTWTNWVDALYQALPNLNTYFDAVAIHPYGTNTTTLTSIGDDQIRRTELIHQAFTNHNATNKPLWITEVGWPTCTQGPLCVTPTQQATNTTTLFNYIHTTWAPYVKAAFIFNYQDYGGDPTYTEDNYGLVAQDNTPKPALTIFKTQASRSLL
jgi:Beta-galactosidase